MNLSHLSSNFALTLLAWVILTQLWTTRPASSILARGRKISLSRASMVSPPFKLKMFSVSVCVLLTSVSLKLIKIKINLRNHEFVTKQNGGWKVSDADWFYFSFYDPSWFFYYPSLSESNIILFLFFYSIRVDPSWFNPDWRSELIRSKAKFYSGCKLSAHFWKMNSLEDSLNTDR